MYIQRLEAGPLGLSIVTRARFRDIRNRRPNRHIPGVVDKIVNGIVDYGR